MSKKLFLLPALLLAASVLFVTSCKKDCSFKQADYTGSYFVDEDCTNSPAAAYTVAITTGASETELKLVNVWEFFNASVIATIDCETINIARQEPNGDGFFVVGSGFIEKKDGITTITLSYTVTDESVTPFDSDECTGTVYIQQ